jgi:hypothetical protein
MIAGFLIALRRTSLRLRATARSSGFKETIQITKLIVKNDWAPPLTNLIE